MKYHWHEDLQSGLRDGFLPPIRAEEIRAASSTFPAHTAFGPDGWRPRDIGLLSDSALERLATLFSLAEVAAFPLEELMDVVFLPKPGAGERPIGLLCTLLRLWCRCRRKYARALHAANDRDYFWAAEGRSSEEAVHHQGLQVELARARGLGPY